MKRVLHINNKIPRWLTISSSFAIAFIVLLIPFIAWLLEYKDTIHASLEISAKNVPIKIFSKTTGEIILLTKDKTAVTPNTPLAYLKNPANFDDVNELKRILAEEKLKNSGSGKLKNLVLGEIQPFYINLIEAIDNYETFIGTDPYQALMEFRQDQIELFRSKRKLFKKRADILNKDKSIEEKLLKIDKELMETNLIAKKEFDRAVQVKMKKNLADLDNQNYLNEIDLNIKVLEQEKVEIYGVYHDKKEKLTEEINRAVDVLTNQITKWETKFLIKSNIFGKCIYNNHLTNFQLVEPQDLLFNIAPISPKQYLGLLKLPMTGAGKVCIGQTVNAKLDNYPFTEFGILKGEIESISEVPFNDQFNVKINFPNGFITTYGDTLKNTQFIKGRGEIIVGKRSLFNRIIDQIESIKKNR